MLSLFFTICQCGGKLFHIGGGKYECEKCGCAIRSGRFCMDCAKEASASNGNDVRASF